MTFLNNKIIVTTLLILTINLFSYTAIAGFLDMPDLSETPTLERKSMLRDIDIPPVSDRNPDPNAGPRLAVSEFRIQGLVEYPDLGITREALNRLVEGIRFNLMAEGKLLESGYSLEELGDLSDLLVDIEEETMERHVTPLEVQKLVWLIRDQRSKRGITLGQIETIADEITRFYRKRGFILAKAYIPKQQVRDGIVNLTLLLGMLGEVEVIGNDMYSERTIASVFDGMLSTPVTHAAVEENLYLINDFPGIVVDGFFEQGHQVGDTKLNINVKDEQKFYSNIRIDNHGTKETGLYRLYLDGQVNNLLGFADYLNVSILSASSPSNTNYWRINYETSFFSPRIKLILDASQNQFVVDQSSGFGSLPLNGVVDVYDIIAQYILQRSRTQNHKVELKYDEISSDLKLGDINTDALDEKLNNTTLTYYFDILEEKNRRLHQGSVRWVNGNIVIGLSDNQDENYNILVADYSLLAFMKLPWVDANTKLIFRTAAQYSGTSLSSIMRAPLGGPTRARAFPINTFTVDDGIYFGVDWVFNSPTFMDVNLGPVNLRRLIQPFVFADYAYGQQYILFEGVNDVTGQFADVGFGLKFAYTADFHGNLQFAFPVSQKVDSIDGIGEEEGMRVVFDFQYRIF